MLEFLDYGVRLCHGSKSCSNDETVGRVSLLVSTTGLTTCRAACMASHYSANSRFRISSPNSMGRLQFIIATVNLVTLTPMHKLYIFDVETHNAATKRLVQKVTINL